LLHHGARSDRSGNELSSQQSLSDDALQFLISSPVNNNDVHIPPVHTSRDASPLNFDVSSNESPSENESIDDSAEEEKEDEDDDENTVFGLEWHDDDGFCELIYPSSDDEEGSEDEEEFEEKFSDSERLA
jgi:hypothetical protein